MHEHEREELLSAYLDGELPADERARVEQWLAASPELRTLRDELLAMRRDLQALPRHKLDRDLAGSVLRQAERATLSGAGQATTRDGTAAATTAGGGDGEVSPGSVISQWWSQGAGWRRLAWPAAAIAAALAIAMFETRREREIPQVAQNAPRNEGAFEMRGADASRLADDERSPIAIDNRESDLKKSALEHQPPAAEPSQRSNELNKIATDGPAVQFAPAAPMAAPAESEQQRSARRNTREDGRQVDEGYLAQPTSQDKTDSAGVARQAESAAATDSLGAKAAQAAEEIKLVEFSCDPEFLRERRLEKLLDERKIAFVRDSLGEEKDRDAATAQRMREELQRYRQEAAGKESERIEHYAVTVTPEQLNQLVADVEQIGSRVVRQSGAGPAQRSAVGMQSESSAQGGRAADRGYLQAPGGASPYSQAAAAPARGNSQTPAIVTIRLKAVAPSAPTQTKP